MEIAEEYLIDIVDRALTEDIGDGDVTTHATVAPTAYGKGVISAKESGIISGLDLAALVFYRLDADSDFATDLFEGATVKKGDRLVTVSGSLQALLTGERTALNFLMHLSGIATLTARFVEQVKHTRCRIIDTRKTTPGVRMLEKRAVVSGGGTNHRIGLYDMILIKNNHIAAAGSITNAVGAAVQRRLRSNQPQFKIEVETRNLAEVREAVHLQVDRIMLDNFSITEAAEAVREIRNVAPELEIEASGNMNLQTVKSYAETGVDLISVGAITHSAPWLDLSMAIGSA